jgi:hypothetical protein
VSQSEEKTGSLVPDPECRAELGVDPTQWSRWERALLNFPEPVVVLGRKYRRRAEWAPFRDALLSAGDGSAPHRPRRKAEAAT